MDTYRASITAANQLAELLNDQRGAETMSALRWTMAACRRFVAAQPDEADPFRRRLGRVGRWYVVDTELGRGLRQLEVSDSEASTWSSVDDVAGKGDAKRVVLVGESAARGYLLDPVFNPALALQRHLSSMPVESRFQCVDLAHTSIELWHLRRIIAATAHLETDVLVMFAGNNWTISSYQLTDPQSTAVLARELRRSGYAGMRQALRNDVLLPQVRSLLGDLLKLRARTGLQLIVVVPEFNLTGWSPLGAVNTVDVPMLDEDALSRWYELRSSAVGAAADGHWQLVRDLAKEMADLDEGMSPVPGYLLGSALQVPGDHAGAREAFEGARDSLCGLAVKYLPRTPRIVQDLLVRFCEENDVDCVDLRTVLGKAEAPELPDPSYFLDYCHLSDTGIDLAMAAVAERITGERSHGSPQPAVDGWTRAVSLVLAATYNSFCGQPLEVVRGYLSRAVEACPDVRDLLRSLNELLARPGPVWASPALDALAREPNAAVVFERLSDYRPDQSRLWTLRECLLDLLGAQEQAGRCGGPRAGGTVELLDIASTKLGVGAVPNYAQQRCYLQANLQATEVRFFLYTPSTARLRLVHRRREGIRAPAHVQVNDTAVGQFLAGPRWSTSEFTLPVDVTRSGVNLVRVTWPGAAVSLGTRISEDAAALARGAPPYVLPIFGELYSMTFSPGLGESEDPTSCMG